MDEVSRFAEVARAFCVFVREAHELALPERLHLARRAAADLFAAGCALPQGDGRAPDVEDEIEVPASWPGFGEFDHYREVFDPYDWTDDEPGVGSLTDDFLDIYRDVNRGLLPYDRGEHGSAVWEWRFHFDIHWGDHAVDALRALKRACYRAGDPDTADDASLPTV